MATNGYPHLVFVQPDPGLDKATLAALLGRTFPDSPVQDKPLRLDLDRGGYLFSFWFEDAEGVAERYATYLPEGARRRWLSRCETMIDLHGAADPHGDHADDARRIVEALLDLDGAAVFSEQTRRFVGMDYGDVPSVTGPAAGVASPPVPAAAPVPAAPPVPASPPLPTAPMAVPIAIRAASAPEPPVPDEPAVPAPSAPQPPEPQPQPAVSLASPPLEPAAQTPAGERAPESRPATQPEPAGENVAERAKPGLFKRVFGRR